MYEADGEKSPVLIDAVIEDIEVPKKVQIRKILLFRKHNP